MIIRQHAQRVHVPQRIREILVKDVNNPPPPRWSYDGMCNMLKTPKNQILYPHFGKPHFLKFATLSRDRNWHISKLTTHRRAPYQPHAKNNHNVTTGACLIHIRWVQTFAMEISRDLGILPDGEVIHFTKWWGKKDWNGVVYPQNPADYHHCSWFLLKKQFALWLFNLANWKISNFIAGKSSFLSSN